MLLAQTRMNRQAPTEASWKAWSRSAWLIGNPATGRSVRRVGKKIHLPDEDGESRIWPMSDGTLIADISAVRNRLRVTGADRVEFLHGQCTNDIKRLVVGETCYAAFLNAKGKMRGEGYVICQSDAFLLETSLGLAQSLEKFIITEDVTVVACTIFRSANGSRKSFPCGAPRWESI